MRRVAAALLLAATVLGVASPAHAARCGRDEPDACRLLTRKELARTFDQPAGTPSASLGPGFCQWKLRATDTRAAGQVNTLVEHGKQAKRDFAVAADFADSVVIDGIGRKALYTPSSGTLWVLAAGPTLFYVQANVYDVDANRITDGLEDQLLGLATRAQARV